MIEGPAGGLSLAVAVCLGCPEKGAKGMEVGRSGVVTVSLVVEPSFAGMPWMVRMASGTGDPGNAKIERIGDSIDGWNQNPYRLFGARSKAEFSRLEKARSLHGSLPEFPNFRMA